MTSAGFVWSELLNKNLITHLPNSPLRPISFIEDEINVQFYVDGLWYTLQSLGCAVGC